MWTNAKPTKPGWYWYTDELGTGIVHVEFDDIFCENSMVVYFSGDDRHYCVDDWDGLWSSEPIAALPGVETVTKP